MYQRYPTGSQGPVAPVAPPEPPAPQSVLNAVKIMYVGAALSVIQFIVGLTTIDSYRSALRSAYPNYSDAQIHTTLVAGVTVLVVGNVIEIGLWVWMAWANGRGRSWARIVAGVLFAINTIQFFYVLATPHTAVSLVFAVLVWLAGLGATYFLWQKDSSGYIQARSQPVR
jgi:hypothetical protein